MIQCKYCMSPENKQYKPCLTCKICELSVHLDCLTGSKTPGNFAGDIFFVYTCAECTEDGSEIFEREKLTWLNCLFLIINDLTIKRVGISNRGYFHRVNQIGTFINKHWNDIFPPTVKQKKNWCGTVSGVLSTYTPLFFESGSMVLKDSGWWKLAHKFSPSLYSHLVSEINLTKQKRRSNKNAKESTEAETDFEILTRLSTEMGFGDLLSKNILLNEKLNETEEEISPIKKQKIGIQYTENSSLNLLSSNEPDPTILDKYFSNYFMDGDDSLSDFDNLLPDLDEIPESGGEILLQNDFNDSLHVKNTDISQKSSYMESESLLLTQDNIFSTSDDESQSLESENTSTHQKRIKDAVTANRSSSNQTSVQSLFSKNENGFSMPWENSNCVAIYHKKECSRPTTEYEEVQMLNHLNNVLRKAQYLNTDDDLVRLRSKLALRRLKRSKRLPLFNFDTLVCRLANYHVQDELMNISQYNRRVLDRFQGIPDDLLSAAISPFNISTRLIGFTEPCPFTSPYSGRLLKPYIRRDLETTPLWLRIMNELQNKVNGTTPDWVPPQRAPLDYCYVRPQHITAINSLCSHFFWPGIDLTEVLQYPDFSCVVLYKKLVVAFTFLVPDVGPNEAYISFIFTRPEWRNAGIANFMLYHLIQTCIGKDITLHVSPTNPAIFLYQKFGFKVEQLMQEFYDKYLPVESTECKHALLLRLCR